MSFCSTVADSFRKNRHLREESTAVLLLGNWKIISISTDCRNQFNRETTLISLFFCSDVSKVTLGLGTHTYTLSGLVGHLSSCSPDWQLNAVIALMSLFFVLRLLFNLTCPYRFHSIINPLPRHNERHTLALFCHDRREIIATPLSKIKREEGKKNDCPSHRRNENGVCRFCRCWRYYMTWKKMAGHLLELKDVGFSTFLRRNDFLAKVVFPPTHALNCSHHPEDWFFKSIFFFWLVFFLAFSKTKRSSWLFREFKTREFTELVIIFLGLFFPHSSQIASFIFFTLTR